MSISPLAKPLRLAKTPIAGGRDHEGHMTRSEADVVVSTAQELKAAIGTRKQIVWCEPGRTFDLSGIVLRPAEGVTIASDRGRENSLGAFFKTTDRGEESSAWRGTIQIRQPDVRITGIRFRGPQLGYFDSKKQYNRHYARGIHVVAGPTRIDNCEIYGFTHAGIACGTRTDCPRTKVQGCWIHDCMMESYGYCVDIFCGHTTVENCYLDGYRHAVNGFGHPNCNYDVFNTVVGPRCASHALDMHSLHENVESGLSDDPAAENYRFRAGGEIRIRNVTFELSRDIKGSIQEGVTIRGVPANGVWLENSWFQKFAGPPTKPGGDHGMAYQQRNVDKPWRRFWAKNNAFGPAIPRPDIGAPRSPELDR